MLIFGRPRVSPALYFVSTVMVAIGTTFSAFWIMVNNSWTQVPVGMSYNTEYLCRQTGMPSSFRSMADRVTYWHVDDIDVVVPVDAIATTERLVRDFIHEIQRAAFQAI